MRDRSRATKYVVAIVALTAAAIVTFASRDGGRTLPSRFRFVCVATGEISFLSVAEAACVPARNRKTGQHTLLPCDADPYGGFRIAESDRWLLDGELRDSNHYVEPDTLKVRSAP